MILIGLNINLALNNHSEVLEKLNMISKSLPISYKILNKDIVLDEFIKSDFHNSQIKNNNLDYIFSIGGDGTVLSTLREYSHLNIPILGINIGHLGFLTESNKNDLPDVMKMIVEKKIKIENRLLLSFDLLQNGKKTNFIAANDIVIDRGKSARIMQTDLYISNSLLNSFKGDGLILSTPNGSTGYALSAGGPIIPPNLKVISITPICPHSLSARPVIVNSEENIIIKFPEQKLLRTVTIDGQITIDIDNQSEIYITSSEYKARFIIISEYYEKLRNKMHW